MDRSVTGAAAYMPMDGDAEQCGGEEEEPASHD